MGSSAPLSCAGSTLHDHNNRATADHSDRIRLSILQVSATEPLATESFPDQSAERVAGSENRKCAIDGNANCVRSADITQSAEPALFEDRT
jgi:hypothetical protein